MAVIFKKPRLGNRAHEVFVCEFLGSAMTMYFGCLGLYADANRYVELQPLQGALIWGLVVCPISIAIGYISGGQCNPCVTLCYLILGEMSVLDAQTYVYLVAQFLGHMFGTTLAVVLVPYSLYREYDENTHCGFCSTAAGLSVNAWQVFFMEFWATFVLILYVCGASDPRTANVKDTEPLMFAFLMTMFTITIGPFTGNSSNPFRTLAPAVLSNCWEDHYVYWIGPFGGTASASLLYKYVLKLRADDLDKYELPSTTIMPMGVQSEKEMPPPRDFNATRSRRGRENQLPRMQRDRRRR